MVQQKDGRSWAPGDLVEHSQAARQLRVYVREHCIFFHVKSLLFDLCYYHQTNSLTNHTRRIYAEAEMSLICVGTEKSLV